MRRDRARADAVLVEQVEEVIIYDRVLSDADRNAVNAYLRSKYNLP